VLVKAAAALAYLMTFLAILVWVPLTALLLVLTWPFDRNRTVPGRFLRLCAAFASRSFPYWRIHMAGRWPEGRQAYVVVSNHQSMLDIFLISNIPHEMKWVAKEEVFKVPYVGWAFRFSGDIPVDRKDAASGSAALARARRYLERGMSVMMFPEGTRSRDGTMLPFKAGAFRLALDARVPVLPLVVNGSADGFPKGSPWIRPARLDLRILEPVPVAGLGDDDVAKLRDEVRSRIEKALAEIRGNVAHLDGAA